MEYGFGGSVSYSHDQAGNIIQVDVQETDDTTLTQYTTVGSMNRVDRIRYGDEASISVSYDGMARPKSIAANSDTVTVEYTSRGIIDKLTSSNTGDVWRNDGSFPRPQSPVDRMLQALAGGSSFNVGRGFSILGFDPVTFDAMLFDPSEIGIPGYAQARALAVVGTPFFAEDHATSVVQFEKPSNPIFQPREYRSTNCCVPCLWDLCLQCSVGSAPENLAYFKKSAGTSATAKVQIYIHYPASMMAAAVEAHRRPCCQAYRYPPQDHRLPSSPVNLKCRKWNSRPRGHLIV